MLLGEVIAVLSWKVGEFYTKYFMSLLQAAKLSTVTLEQPVLIQIILCMYSFYMGDFKLWSRSLSSTIDVSSSERDDNSDGFTV